MGVDAHLSDLQNRAAAENIQRFLNTELCSAGIGAAPRLAENPHFHFHRNRVFASVLRGITCLSIRRERWQKKLL